MKKLRRKNKDGDEDQKKENPEWTESFNELVTEKKRKQGVGRRGRHQG